MEINISICSCRWIRWKLMHAIHKIKFSKKNKRMDKIIRLSWRSKLNVESPHVKNILLTRLLVL